MPLFVLVSGYFSITDKVNFKTILKPLIVFQLLNILLLLAYGYGFSISYFFVPYWTLWYLLSLMFWKILLFLTPSQLLSKPYWVLSIAFVFSMTIGLLIHNGRVLSIQRTIVFMPYFYLGYYFRQGYIKQSLWSKNLSIFFVIFLGLIISFVWCPSDASILLRGADPYTINDLPNKLLITSCTLVLSYSIWNLKYENLYLSEIGKESLFYYLYHGIVIKFLFEPLITRLNLPTNLLCCIVYSLMILLLLKHMRKYRLFQWLVCPTLKSK